MGGSSQLTEEIDTKSSPGASPQDTQAAGKWDRAGTQPRAVLAPPWLWHTSMPRSPNPNLTVHVFRVIRTAEHEHIRGTVPVTRLGPWKGMG